AGAGAAGQRTCSVWWCSKSAPALNCAMPLVRSAGGVSPHRARAGSFGAPAGARFGGRAALRARLSGWGVLGPEDLSKAKLVLDELTHHLVLEGFRKIFGRVGVCDFDAFVQVMRG